MDTLLVYLPKLPMNHGTRGFARRKWCKWKQNCKNCNPTAWSIAMRYSASENSVVASNHQALDIQSYLLRKFFSCVFGGPNTLPHEVFGGFKYPNIKLGGETSTCFSFHPQKLGFRWIQFD